MVTIGSAAFLSVCLATTQHLGHALGPRGADVVGAQHLQHGRAREPRDGGHREGAERERGQHEVPPVAAARGREAGRP